MSKVTFETSPRPAIDKFVTNSDASAKAIRGLLWVYLFLLLFEGAFRKWITPGLSNYILIVRDPVVIAMYVLAASAGLFPRGFFSGSLAVVALLTGLCGLVAENFDWRVYLFGMRTDFLHLWLIFLIPNVMGYKQVVKMGRWVLIIALPMTLLTLKQFQAPPDDLINTTAGQGGLQLGTSAGKVRTTGTFSFIAGIVCFYSVVAAFVINGLIRHKTHSRWLLFAGAAAVVAAVATSGSRSALTAVLGVTAVLTLATVVRPQLMGRVVMAALVLGLITCVVLQMGVVVEGAKDLTLRFQEAGGGGGFWPRLFGGLLLPMHEVTTASLTGAGLGYGTNAGSGILKGHAEFLLAEDEWRRVILESGPICGILFIAWRVAVCVHLFCLSVREVKDGNILPLLLLASCGGLIYSGQLGQPTILGFAALIGGLCLASTKGACERADPEPHEFGVIKTDPLIRRRGRSKYAETLHGNTN